MNFESTLSSYRDLLEANPGTALVIGEDCVAILIDGNLCGAHVGNSAAVNLENAFDFDRNGWDSDNDCWDADVSASSTSYCITHPVFLPLE